MNPLAVLKNILASVGLHNENLENITISGVDPILPSPFALGTAGATSLIALGYVSAKLYYMRTGKKQNIAVEIKNAVVAERAHNYTRLLESDTPKLWDELSGFYQDINNRYIQFHCNFPHHRQGIVDFLNCQNNKQSVIDAVKQLDARTLEHELNQLGLCASMVRTVHEWQDHPQAQAIEKLPLLEVSKIGESSPEFVGANIRNEELRPLSGIKVLDLTRVIAGPVCAKTLAEHGATVMHIASPHLPSIPLLEMETGNGKLSAYLDLKNKDDAEKLSGLIKGADIFLQAYRPNGLNELGFSPENVAKIRPGIIYCYALC